LAHTLFPLFSTFQVRSISKLTELVLLLITGTIDSSEVGTAAWFLGHKPYEAEVIDVIRKVKRMAVSQADRLFKSFHLSPISYRLQADGDGNGTIDSAGFIKRRSNDFIKRRSSASRGDDEGNFEDEMLEAFNVFDSDGNGFITGNELRQMMTNLEEKLTEEEVAAMFQEADLEGDDQMNYEQFENMMFK
jgi:calmodulin